MGVAPDRDRCAAIVTNDQRIGVTVFFDEIERVSDLPYGADLFVTLQDCYSRRVSEPDLARLNFVVLGVASPAAPRGTQGDGVR